MTEPGQSLKSPVATGCIGLLAIAVLVIAGGCFTLVYLDSGSDSGKLVLEPAAAYASGTVEYVGARNFYLVRLGDGSFLALADLDAANRTSGGRRCRVAPAAADDPELPSLLKAYSGSFSVAARGATLLFREPCNGAIYDVAGLRLDATSSPNLDRYPVEVRKDGRVVVDVSRRRCTLAAGDEPFAPIRCP